MKTENQICTILFFICIGAIIYAFTTPITRCELKYGYIYENNECQLMFDWQKKLMK